MLLQELPPEILTQIASYLPIHDAEVFSRACHNCYFAALPHIWHHLSLHDASELNIVAKRLKKNDVWAQRAIQFVRDVSLTQGDHKRKYSPTVAATMFGIAALPSDQASEESEHQSLNSKRERIGRFGKRLLKMFPHLSNLVLDFHEAVRDFYNDATTSPSTNTLSVPNTRRRSSSTTSEDDDMIPDDIRLPYSGSVSLINYKSDNTRFMHYLLSPFRRSQHLKVQASPIVSLCDDIDESILTDQDIIDLASMGLTHLRKLELSYLDNNVSLDALTKLIKGLPRINELDLEWVFPPSKQEFTMLCQELKNCGSLYTDKVCTTKCNIMHAHFTRLVTNH